MFRTFEPLFPDGAGPDGSHPISELVESVLFGKAGGRNQRDPDVWLPIGHNHHAGAAVTLYSPGKLRLRSVRTGPDALATLSRALLAARRHDRFCEFSPDCRITIDFFGIADQPIRFGDFKVGSLRSDRFEFGVDGLFAKAGGKNQYFLPGDSYVRSIYGLQALSQHLSKMLGVKDVKDCLFRKISSTSIVNHGGRWLHLFRGHPVYDGVSIEDVETVRDRAIDHILKYRGSDGRFLYYYNAAKDNEINHEHPKRDPLADPYYNELRHSGGIITLLLAAASRGGEAVRPAVEAAIEFLLRNSVAYVGPDGKTARHIIFNRKSKLGGAGLALYALSFYQKLYESDKYSRFADEFASHLHAEILPSGEFRYYHIYLDKVISPDENQNYFSFYYPGEALIGLATYLKWVNTDTERHARLAEGIRSALRFLLVDRPLIHKAHYATLPSDAWLMAAINELADLPGLDDESYAEFVFEDADRMLALMYTERNALYPDYPGAFYYRYGDLPYPDGARCEGLVAALELAMKRRDNDRIARYAGGLVKSIRATILLANTPESLYFAPNPEKALGAIRFKLTRQWSRIDTIQHVVCYYMRFLAAYETLLGQSVALDDRLLERPGASNMTGIEAG